jgi:Tfp pilus assembly ATPase PilU
MGAKPWIKLKPGHLCLSTLHANNSDQALFELYETSQISYASALRHADSVNNLRLRIKLESKRSLPNELNTTETLKLHADNKVTSPPAAITY